MNAQELHESAISYYEGTKNIPQDFKKAYDLFYCKEYLEKGASAEKH